MHNVNVNTFSFSRKLLSGENTFFMEYLQATASSKYPPKKLFRKFSKDSSEITLAAWRKSFLMMLQTLYLKLYKNVVVSSMFSYKFWEYFRTTFPLKNLCDYLWMGSINSVKTHLQNTSKTLPKYVTNVANMLKIISLTGTPHNLVRRFLECYRDIYFFVNKG